MAWEQRGGRLYYYRKRREQGRVVSEYIGTGEFAEVMARLDELKSLEQELERMAWREMDDEQRNLDRHIAAFGELVSTMTAAVLLASEFHQHKRQWRVRRLGRQDDDDAEDAGTARTG